MSILRHFTATGFVVHKNRILLHWHPKVRAWLPPGGHIEANEDPVQTVLREVREEAGVQAEIVPTGCTLNIDYPIQIVSPFTIMEEDIQDPVTGYHQHIDMIYICRLAEPIGRLNDGWAWIDREVFENRIALKSNLACAEPPPEDVRLIALKAFEVVAASNRDDH